MTLLEYLPDAYMDSPEVRIIQGAIQPEVAAVWAAEHGLFDQLNVSKATWGLAAWERALGLAVDVSQSVEYRRTRITSKLRGQGTTTVAMIKNVATGYSNGAVDVIERPALYQLDIKMIGTIGIPPNMDDLKKAIEEIKPAHLECTYIIEYQTGTLGVNVGFFVHMGDDMTFNMIH